MYSTVHIYSTVCVCVCVCLHAFGHTMNLKEKITWEGLEKGKEMGHDVIIL